MDCNHGSITTIYYECTITNSTSITISTGRKRLNFDIEISFEIETANNKATVAVTNSKYLYWSMEQQVAHHTVNGCNLQIGDLLGTGTISGKEKQALVVY